MKELSVFHQLYKQFMKEGLLMVDIDGFLVTMECFMGLPLNDVEEVDNRLRGHMDGIMYRAIRGI